MIFVPVIVALLVGALLAVQTGANLQLAAAMRSPIAASTTQLALGTAVLAVLAAVVGTLGRISLVSSLTWWHLLGGLGSALFITAGILVVPRLGALVTVGLMITGQMLASLAVDAAGLLGVARRPLDLITLAGAATVLAGAAAITRTGSAGPAAPLRFAWSALAVAAGAGLALQGPINGQLRNDLHAPVTAGAFSFLVATAAMALVFTLGQLLTHAPRPQSPVTSTMPWWGWAGALVGALYVTTVPVLIPHLGTAATIGFTVAGQQLASLAVDRFGLLRLPRRPVTAVRLAGTLLLLAGVALMQA